MKKIFFIAILFFGLSIVASAQVTKTKVEPKIAVDYSKINVQEYSKKDATELGKLLSLNETQLHDFYNLFEMKYLVLSNSKMSAERISEIKRVTEAKIRASLDGNQMQILEKDKVLFERLIN